MKRTRRTQYGKRTENPLETSTVVDTIGLQEAAEQVARTTRTLEPGLLGLTLLLR